MASGHVTVPRKQAGHMAAPTSIALASIKPLPTGSRPHMAINPRRRAGQSFSTLPPISDINLLGDVQGVVHLDPRESYRTRRRAVSVFWCPRVPVRPHESLRAGKLARLADFAGYLTSHRHSNGVSHLKGAANSGGLHHDW